MTSPSPLPLPHPTLPCLKYVGSAEEVRSVVVAGEASSWPAASCLASFPGQKNGKAARTTDGGKIPNSWNLVKIIFHRSERRWSIASPLASSVAKNKGDMISPNGSGEARRAIFPGGQKWGPQFDPLGGQPHIQWYGKWAALGSLGPVNLGAVGNLKPYIFPLARNWGDQ